jgi:hypothetical protein
MKDFPRMDPQRFAELKAKVEAFRKAKAEQLAADQNGDHPPAVDSDHTDQ